MTASVRLTVIIPILNMVDTLMSTLLQFNAARACGFIDDIVVSDGGSRDGSVTIAEKAGVTVVEGAQGRGAQLALGAQAAQGEWLLFLHADTTLEDGWEADVAAFIAANGPFVAAAFRFALDDDGPMARRLERMVAWRCRVLSLPYGDQGLLISRQMYDRLGGFRAIPLMEDVDLVRRIGRRRLSILTSRAVTSAARFRRNGYIRRSARNLGCLSLYLAGVSPRLIARLYG